jgi:serine/threonine protein kinase
MAFPSRTEIVTAMKNPQACYKATELIGGNVLYKGTNVIQYAGGYTTVFPFIDGNGKKVAIRCWCADIGNAQERSQKISDFLNKLQSSYFVDFKYVDKALLIKGVLQPIVVMDWVEGQPLKEHINANLNSNSLTALAEKFEEMVKFFHCRNISHGDLQHGNIIVKPNGDLVLVDYDSMYIDTLKGMPDVIKGLPGYQHPARINNQFVNPKADYFSELVIYLSLLIFADEPLLWRNYCDTEDLLFSKEDFANIQHSSIYSKYRNSSNKTISNLMQQMEEELKKNDIQNLLPLQELLIDKVEKMIIEISNKWDDQPNPPVPQIYNPPDIDTISKKF